MIASASALMRVRSRSSSLQPTFRQALRATSGLRSAIAVTARPLVVGTWARNIEPNLPAPMRPTCTSGRVPKPLAAAVIVFIPISFRKQDHSGWQTASFGSCRRTGALRSPGGRSSPRAHQLEAPDVCMRDLNMPTCPLLPFRIAELFVIDFRNHATLERERQPPACSAFGLASAWEACLRRRAGMEGAS